MHSIIRPINQLSTLWLLIILLGGCGSDSSRSQPAAPDSSSASVQTSGVDAANRPHPPPSEPELRIRVLSRALPFQPLVLGSSGQRLLIHDDGEFQTRILEAPIKLELDETAGWRISDASNHQMETAAPCTISIRTMRTESSAIQIEGKVYPGTLELVPITSASESEVPPIDRMDLVARVAIESYLPGVLDGELYGHWPLTTFKAQAVAARSYAVAEHAYWRDRRHFDLVAGPASQVWNGIDSSKTARDAAESTRGIVLLHEGRVVPAYYSSCCGGVPASALEAISDRGTHAIPPLQPRRTTQPCCEKAPVREWELRYPLIEVESAITTALPGESFGSMDGIEVSKRNPAGRPLEYTVRDRGGRSVSLSARSFRSILSRVTPTGSAQAVAPKSDALEPSLTDGALVVLGRGFGHGVGLCQFGACARGEAGDTWEEIVLSYYPGAELVRSWD